MRQRLDDGPYEIYLMLLKKLSEASRKTVHKVYMDKYHPDPNKLYKNLTAR